MFCQFISWTNWVNSFKFMDNCWISCQVMADMKKVCDDLIIINLYCGDLSRQFLTGTCIDPKNLKLHICWHFFEIAGGRTVCASYLLAVHTSYILGTIERKLIKKIRTPEKWLQYRPLPNSFPTNYILINSSIVLSYWAYVLNM